MRATVVPQLLGLLLLAGCGPGPQELTYEEYVRSTPTLEVLVFDFPDRDGARLLSPHVLRVPRGQPGEDEAARAVRALLAHRPATGRGSLWHGMCSPGAGVQDVERTPSLLTVRLAGFAPGSTGHATCDLTVEGRQLQRQQVAWTVRATTWKDLPVRVVDERGNELVAPTRALPRYLDRASLTHFEELLDLVPQSEASSSPTKTPAA